MVRKGSPGVIFLAILLIHSVVIKIPGYLNLDWYWTIFRDYPHEVILLRYCVSWTLVIVTLVAGIGLIFLNDFCRKLAIYMNVFTILTIHLKHPQQMMEKHCVYYYSYIERLNQIMGFRDNNVLTEANVAFWASTIAIVLDVFLALLIIFFFTRKSVKQQFIPGKKLSGQKT